MIMTMMVMIVVMMIAVLNVDGHDDDDDDDDYDDNEISSAYIPLYSRNVPPIFPLYPPDCYCIFQVLHFSASPTLGGGGGTTFHF